MRQVPMLFGDEPLSPGFARPKARTIKRDKAAADPQATGEHSESRWWKRAGNPPIVSRQMYLSGAEACGRCEHFAETLPLFVEPTGVCTKTKSAFGGLVLFERHTCDDYAPRSKARLPVLLDHPRDQLVLGNLRCDECSAYTALRDIEAWGICASYASPKDGRLTASGASCSAFGSNKER